MKDPTLILSNIINQDFQLSMKISPDGSGYSNKIGRDNLIDYLGTKRYTSVHFKPLHLYDLLKDENKTLPVSEKVWVQLISLPCHNGMTDDDIDYVIYWVNRFIEEEYEK